MLSKFDNNGADYQVQSEDVVPTDEGSISDSGDEVITTDKKIDSIDYKLDGKPDSKKNDSIDNKPDSSAMETCKNDVVDVMENNSRWQTLRFATQNDDLSNYLPRLVVLTEDTVSECYEAPIQAYLAPNLRK